MRLQENVFLSQYNQIWNEWEYRCLFAVYQWTAEYCVNSLSAGQPPRVITNYFVSSSPQKASPLTECTSSNTVQ